MNSLCQFHLNHMIMTSGTHLVYPYCGCGWIGEMSMFAPSNSGLALLTDRDLENMARRWEMHRTRFRAQQEARRSFLP